jgi:hypothetical protein
MNSKKKLVLIATASTTFIGAILNMSLNSQYENRSVFLGNIEALTVEYDDDIDLDGSLIWMPTKSISNSQPFQAIKHSSYIQVNYLVNLNNITVRIVNASGGTAYSNTVNPVAGGQLNISLAGLSAGSYTIVFTAPNGSSVYGDFEI